MDGGERRVSQQKELSMGWCLSCHRDPAPNLRPPGQVTNLMWGSNLTAKQIEEIKRYGVTGLKPGDDLTDEQRLKIGQQVRAHLNIKTPRQMADCSACHR